MKVPPKEPLSISPREQEVLQLIAYEHTSAEIAKQLYISNHTAISHRKNLMEKLHVRNTAGLVRRAFELDLITLRPTVGSQQQEDTMSHHLYLLQTSQSK